MFRVWLPSPIVPKPYFSTPGGVFVIPDSDRILGAFKRG